MNNIKTYQEWEDKIDSLVNILLKKDVLLRQYAIWLESSEENTTWKGEDIYHRLEGVLQGLSDVDFIPGTGWMNFVAIVGEAQRKTGLDLGVCPYLIDNVREFKKFEYGGNKSKNSLSRCERNKDLSIGSLKSCLPSERSNCKYRKADSR